MRDYQRIMRDLREDHDLTQEKVAQLIGTSQTMYARYERGASEMPIRHLINLSNLYDVSTDYILGLSKKKKRILSRSREKTSAGPRIDAPLLVRTGLRLAALACISSA